MEYGERIRQLAYSNYNDRPASPKQLRVVAMLLSEAADSRDARLQMLGAIFNRTFTTSKELSISEAKALIEVGYYVDWAPIPAFTDYLTGLTMEVIF